MGLKRRIGASLKRIFIAILIAGALGGAFSLGRGWDAQRYSSEVPTGSGFSQVALDEALADRDWVNRTTGFSGQVRHLNPNNLEAVLETIDRSPADLTHDEMRLLMHAWTRFDPEAAFEYALFAPEAEKRRMAGAVIYGWAQRDPLAARGALLGIQNTDLEQWLEERFVLGWISGGGLGEAHAYVEALPASKRRELLVSQIAQVLARQGAGVVIDWAEGVDSDELGFKKTVFSKASGALAEYHRPQAMAWVTEQYGQRHAEGSARLVALNWAESDPDAAFEWLASLPPGEEKTQTVGFVFAYWLKTQPEKAAAWLEATESSEALDPAVRAVALARGAKDPAAGLQWARRIHDPGNRERVMVKIGQVWIRTDPEAAKMWLAVSGLPRAAHKSILGSVAPSR